MKRWLKITLGVIGVIVLLFIIDIVCIFTINRPLFAIQNDGGNVYRGIFYDTYNCAEYSTPQIKRKGLKFACSDVKLNVGKVVSIKDTSKELENINSILEKFYEDDNYIYYFNGGISNYIIVEYENGYKESVKNALKYGTITIQDLDRYNIDYTKEVRDNDYKLVSSLDKVDYADTNVLVKFNNKLYAKSNSLIDYAGGSKQIGTIDNVIDRKYIPKLNNETNSKELLNAKVYDETEKSIVLEYNKEFVLFERISE